MPTAAVVIPTYKEKLNEFEKISLAQVRKVLGKYPIIFVAPEGKIFSYFDDNNKVVYFPQEFFQSVETYSRLMLSPEFYEKFFDYDFILIYQLDAFVFSDMLEYFCSLGYDNIGAAWPAFIRPTFNHNGKKYRPKVGNGGFSLRRVKSFYNVLINHADLAKNFYTLAEDTFFSLCGAANIDGFTSAPVNVANKFSAEILPARCVKKNGGDLPFGCHDWNDLDAEFYSKVIPKFGYDLSKIKYKMHSHDDDLMIDNFLRVSALRLTRRLIRGQSVARYIPKINYASMRVINSPPAIAIMENLCKEMAGLIGKIFLYDEKDINAMIEKLSPEKNPHLLISPAVDDETLDELEERGVEYGRVISFQKEYLNYCIELFHNLGK